MERKTERYYFSYERVKATDWVESVSKLLEMPA